MIAAHEVGHADQDATGCTPLRTRTRIAEAAGYIHKVGALLVLAAPALALLLRHPGAVLIGLGAAVLVDHGGRHACCHAAGRVRCGFNRALLVLKEGTVDPRERDRRGAAHPSGWASYTYVAAALIDLINLPRLARLAVLRPTVGRSAATLPLSDPFPMP